MRENMNKNTLKKNEISQNVLNSPMAIDTVIGIAWRHYRTHFFSYLPTALKGTAWMLVPVSLLLVALLYLLQNRLVLSNFSGVTALMVPAWLVLVLWCGAQSLGEFAGISRSVYQTLSAQAQLASAEEAPTEENLKPLSTALRFTHSRKFSLLGSAIVKGAILATVNFIFSSILIFAVVMAFVGLGVLPGSTPSLGLFFGGGAVALVSLILFIWLYSWLALKLLVNEQSLAIESESGALIAIGHSWKLMRNHKMRSLWIVLLASLITLPVSLVAAILAQVGHPFLLQQLGIVITERNATSLGLLPYLTSYLFSTILVLVSGIIVKPFFRTVLTTLYFDIKNRKQSIEA